MDKKEQYIANDILLLSNMEEYIKNLLISLIDNILEDNNLKMSNIEKIGIAMPGVPTDVGFEKVFNLKIDKINFKDLLIQKYNFEYNNILFKNDAISAGLAEKEYGSLKDFDDCVFLTLGTGIGSAVFLNNKLLKTKNNDGFELRSYGNRLIR